MQSYVTAEQHCSSHSLHLAFLACITADRCFWKSLVLRCTSHIVHFPKHEQQRSSWVDSMKEFREHRSHKSGKKRHKKEKHSKKHRKYKKRDRSSSPSSSSSSSDGEGQQHAASLLSQLERERNAVQAARYILSTQPAVRKSFRELLWELDNGRAVGLSGVPDAVLRSQLQHTLELLGLKSTKGQYWLPSGTPTTLSIIGFVFEEPVKVNMAPPPGMVPVAAEPAPTPPPAPEPAVMHTPAAQQISTGPQLPPRTSQQQQQDDMSEDRDKAPAVAAATAGGSPPAAPKTHMGVALQLPQQQAQDQEDQEGQGQEQEAADAPEEPAPKRRMVGPAAPPAELLAAAAAYHADVEAAGGYGPAADAEPLIGPPPPDFVHEADAAPADAREAQVLRVLKALRDAAAADGSSGAAGSTAAAPGSPVIDPYAVLGVDKDADNGTIRKAYWRLSLLVHPDKCAHPAAQEVFQAVSKAAQLLQDRQQRAQHDAAQAEAALRQQALAAAAAAEREIAWKRARGEVVPQELAAVVAAAQHAAPVARDSWMTDLPTGQQRTAASVLAAGLSQVSQTAFNRFGTRPPGDTSGWTDTPQQRAARAAGLLPAAGPAVPALAGPTAAVEGAPVSAELLAAMAKYNEGHRQKSLLEQHAEHVQQGKQKRTGKEKEKSSKDKGSKHKDKDKDKAGKGQKRKAGDEKDADWVGKHPWQPFDRDKDMNVQLQKPKAAADLLKAAGALSSRFSSGR